MAIVDIYRSVKRWAASPGIQVSGKGGYEE